MNVLATQRGQRALPVDARGRGGAPATEVDFIGGALVREAERLGVDAPLQTAVWRLVKAREASYS